MVFCYTIYGLTDLRIHPPPSPSRGPAVRRASTNQVGAGLASPRNRELQAAGRGQNVGDRRLRALNRSDRLIDRNAKQTQSDLSPRPTTTGTPARYGVWVGGRKTGGDGHTGATHRTTRQDTQPSARETYSYLLFRTHTAAQSLGFDRGDSFTVT